MPSNQPELLLQVLEEDGRTTIRFPAGTVLSEANAEALARALRGPAARERPHLVIDLGGVAMLTSAILAKFLALHTQLRGAGGRLSLCNPSADVNQVFRVARLDTVLEVSPHASPLPV
jgi:anti-anti-sigma factor